MHKRWLKQIEINLIKQVLNKEDIIMERELYLVMSFKNFEGRTTTMTLRNIKENVTEAQVQNVMDLILTSNIFTSTGGELVSKVKGEVVEKTTEIFEMA